MILLRLLVAEGNADECELTDIAGFVVVHRHLLTFAERREIEKQQRWQDFMWFGEFSTVSTQNSPARHFCASSGTMCYVFAFGNTVALPFVEMVGERH